MPRRRRSRPGRYAATSRHAGTLFVTGTAGPRRRRRHRGPLPWRGALLALLLIAGAGAAAVLVLQRRAADDRRREAAQAFAAAWERGDVQAMWELAAPSSRPPLEDFERSYARARRAAGVEGVRVGRLGDLRDGRVRAPVTVRTDEFGTLYGFVSLPTVDAEGEGRIAWHPGLRLPGLREDEEVRRVAGREPQRGEVLAADGGRLADDPVGAGIASGLERLHEDRLAGRPAQTLRFGDRVVKRVRRRRGRDVRTFIRLNLTRTALGAIGDRTGGVAVIRPRDGAVLALAGLAVSAPQPPGSTFKIITLAGALEAGIAKPSTTYPVRQFAVLSGVRLHNASSENCGGTLFNSFVHSCNSVFAPLGAELGRRRLLAISERFGFNAELPGIPALEESTVPSDLRDDLAVGAAAIGQERDLATPLQMASVGATIANGGVRALPRLVRSQPVRRRRVVRRSVARTVRDMMVGVVRSGTGTSAAVGGVTVAGKTGTAELVPTQGGPINPENTTAWFVAFAPAQDPQLAVAVMLARSGQGGATAAPVARQVIQAGL